MFLSLLPFFVILPFSVSIYSKFECGEDVFCFQVSNTKFSVNQSLPDVDVFVGFRVERAMDRMYYWQLFLSEMISIRSRLSFEEEADVLISFQTEGTLEPVVSLSITRRGHVLDASAILNDRLIADPKISNRPFVARVTQIDNSTIRFYTKRAFDVLVQLEERQNVTVTVSSPYVTTTVVTTNDFIPIFSSKIRCIDADTGSPAHTWIKCAILLLISSAILFYVLRKNMNSIAGEK